MTEKGIVYKTYFSEEQIDNIVNIITDDWYPLLFVYNEMSLVIGEDIVSSISKDCFTDNRKNIDNNRNEEEYELEISIGQRDVGVIRALGNDKKYSYEEFEKFMKRASNMRKSCEKSMLIPNGLIFISKENEDLWTNTIAKEILFSIDMNERELIEALFQDKEDSNRIESIIKNRKVIVIDASLNRFELIGIKIPLIINKEIVGVLVIIADGTMIRKNEDELNYKSAVIKEIHHRVKNNLQTIASLLGLQMRRVKSKAVERAFNESINRISSIALIHEELSKDGIEKVNIKSTITSIMNMILTNMITPSKNIRGQIIGSDIYIDANKASSLSLCITELIQNAVEHAFPFRKKGDIIIKIEKVENRILITVEDDGIGFSPKKNKKSLGLEIIEMITTETLNGTFNMEGHIYGTSSKISFDI